MTLHFGAPWVLLALLVLPLYFVWQSSESWVGAPERRRRLSLVLRLVLSTVLVVALARPTLWFPSKRVSTVLLVDVSSSVPDRQLDEARRFARDTFRATGGALETITFGRVPLRARIGPDGPIIERHDEGGTDLARAIALGRGLQPGSPRLLLIGDGQDRRPDAVLRAAAGADVEVIRLPGPPLVDARVSGFALPQLVRRQEPARAQISVTSTRGGAATLRVTENALLVEERQVTLTAGAQTFALDLVPGSNGLSRYAATVTLPGDEIPGNDTWVEPALVAGAPRVLIVSGGPEEGTHLEAALTAQDFDVESMSPRSLPSTVEGLLGYDEVILAGLPLAELDPLAEAALVSFVRDTGGGLLVVAGRSGLRRDPSGAPHPLEAVLPVELVAPSERQEPPVALVLLIDRSGSMTGEKLGFAKQAALAVVDKLSAQDQLGVIAFDAKFDWILPLSRVEDKARVRGMIGSLGAGGGTRFLPALEEAYFTLATTNTAVRHAVLLTDGVSTDPDVFAELMAKVRARSITVSTVAIGNGADVKLLKELARLGGGRYHFTARADEVPRIFVDETEQVQRDAAQRRPTPARVALAARELGGVDFAGAPPLAGYLRSRAKAGSEVLLDAPTPSNDPLLVRWRDGLGSVMVFTSDATAAWGEPWLKWPGFGQLWAQLARAAERPRSHRELALTVAADDERLVLTVTASDPRGQLLDDADVHVRVIDGAQATHDVALSAASPGTYRGQLAVPPGAVLARPIARRAGRTLEGDWSVLARPYPSELERVGTNSSLLDRLARGRAPIGDASTLAATRGEKRPAPRDLSVPLALLAVSLFLADLTAKRAQWSRG